MEIDERATTQDTDTIVHAAAKFDPLLMVEPTTNHVKVRVSFKAFGAVFSYPWHARIDQIKLDFLD